MKTDFTEKYKSVVVICGNDTRRTQLQFMIGELVYLTTDPEQLQRFVTGIVIRPNDIIYELACGKDLSNHYEFEMTKDKTVF
jgi:hypothetical protein